MTITLSEPFLSQARDQAARAGYDDVSAYLESLIERAGQQDESRNETLAAVREGLADVAAGRVRPMREALADLARKYQIPPTDGN